MRLKQHGVHTSTKVDILQHKTSSKQQMKTDLRRCSGASFTSFCILQHSTFNSAPH